jgi:MoaA/NifB/PqqE/SkfB family radical SAM enzyme
MNVWRETECNGIQFCPMINWGKMLDYCALSGEEQTCLCHELAPLKKQMATAGLIHNIDGVLRRYQIGEALWEKIPCYVGWFQSRIKVDGTVVTCPACNLLMGSLNDNTLGEIWEGSPYRSFRRQTMTCEGVEELALGTDCDCGFCCHADINSCIHRFFKWFSPFRR